MNQPHPYEGIGNICAGIFIVVVIYNFVRAFYDNSKHIDVSNLDMFTLGRIYGSDTIIIRDDKSDFKSLAIYRDCVDALHSIGMKKSDAQRRAKAIFKKSIPNSVQEFLMIALRKDQ